MNLYIHRKPCHLPPLPPARSTLGRWYSQAGTPRVEAEGKYDAGELALHTLDLSKQ